MRHIAALLAGLIIAPIAWVLIGAGTIGLDPSGAYQGTDGRPSPAISIVMLTVAGVLIGMTAVTRWSPAGPFMVAAVFGGCFGLFRFVMPDFLLPASFSSAMIPAESAAVTGSSGIILAMASLLATALLVPGRWRSNEEDDRVVDTATLSSTSSSTTSEKTDPFGPTSGTLGGPSPSAGSGYDERPTDPFAEPGGYGATQQVPEQRSPYGDDGYDQYGYQRYGGDTQQQYADNQYVQQQQYGGQQYR